MSFVQMRNACYVVGKHELYKFIVYSHHRRDAIYRVSALRCSLYRFPIKLEMTRRHCRRDAIYRVSPQHHRKDAIYRVSQVTDFQSSWK